MAAHAPGGMRVAAERGTWGDFRPYMTAQRPRFGEWGAAVARWRWRSVAGVRAGRGGRTWLALAVVAGALGACGDGGGPGTEAAPETEWVDEGFEPAPFTVPEAPAGYELTLVGRGADPTSVAPVPGPWSNADPSLLLVPADWDGASLAGVVSVATVAANDDSRGSDETFDLDGRSAGWAEARTFSEDYEFNDIEWWPAVMVRPDGRKESSGEGSSLAIEVSGPEATRDELEAIARLAFADDDGRPVLSTVPEGYRLEGRISVAQVESSHGVARGQDGLPTVAGYAASWVGPGEHSLERDPRAHLSVVSMAGGEGADVAMAVLRETASSGFRSEVRAVRAVEIDGRPGWLSEGEHDRVVAFALLDADGADTGALVVARTVDGGLPDGSAGEPGLTSDELLAFAAGIQPMSEDEWDEQAVALAGGPGLHPDLGEVELTRGEYAGEEWLLQSGGVPPYSEYDGEPTYPPLGIGCVLLASGHRVCGATQGVSSTGTLFNTLPDGPSFYIGIAHPEVVAVRALRDTGPEEYPTVAMPGTDTRVWVVPYAGAGFPPAVEKLDASGQVVVP